MTKGFTVIEVLFSALILSSIAIICMYGISNIRSISFEDIKLLDLHQQIRQATDAMIRELRGVVITGITSNSITFNNSTETGVEYYLEANKLIREDPTGTERTLANYIRTLNFCRWDGIDCCNPSSETCSGLHILQIQLSAISIDPNTGVETCFPSPCETPTKILTERIMLRNE